MTLPAKLADFIQIWRNRLPKAQAHGIAVPQSVRGRLLLPLATIVVFLTVGAVVLLWQQQQHRLNDVVAAQEAMVSREFYVDLENQAIGLSMALSSIAADPALQKALRAGDADRLLTTWQPVFETLRQEYNVTHFYFLDLQRICLLRVHKPNQRGDLIERFTAREAERTGKTSFGIELGSLGTLTLRAVQPIFDGNTRIGYVELGKEIEEVIQARRTPGLELAVVIRKERLDRPTWEEGMRFLKRDADWDRLPYSVVIYASQGRMPDAFARLADHDAAGIPHRETDREIVDGGQHWRVSAIPLQDVSGQEVGDLLVMKDVTAEYQAFVRLLTLSGTVSGVLLTFLLGFILMLLGRTDVDIHAQQAALQNTVRFQKDLMDAIPPPIFYKDIQGVYHGSNRAFGRYMGLSPEQIIGKTVHDLLPGTLAKTSDEADRALLNHPGVQQTYDSGVVFPDGVRRDIIINKATFTNTEGEVAGLIGVVLDITERNQLQTKQKEALDRLHKIASRVPGIVFEFCLRADGRSGLPYASEALREIYRASPDEVREDASPLFTKVHPEDFPQHWASINASARDLTPWQNEYRLQFADEPDRWLLGNALPQREADGSTLWHGFITDITDRKHAEKKLRLAANVFTHAREGILITTADGTIIEVNEAFSRITGYSRDEVIGQSPRILKSGIQNAAFYEALWRDLLEKGHWYGEIWNRRKDGTLFAEMQTISSVCDDQGHTREYVALFSDITALKEHESQLEHIAHYDTLTMLPNRVLLADRLHQAMAQSVRRGQPLAVAFLDLDGFKAINDSYGHEAGDQLLMTVASRMKQVLREGDTLARIGGDEFIAVLIDLTDIATSGPLLTRLLTAAAEPVFLGDAVLQVSASLGVTFYPQAEDIDADQLQRQADQAMYQAKQAGKNRYHTFNAEQDRHIRSHHESRERIRTALAQREFVLYYQPRVNMRSGMVLGVEALIRWQHPQQGLLLPATFLSMIEDHPLAVELGDWVIETALTQMEIWQADGLDLAVSINVSARQLQQADFFERLCAILANYPGVPPSCLELEVLETSALKDLSRLSQVITACSQIGIKFALDNFGAGYSSLTYLKHLPVTVLKIDLSFVRDMLDAPENLAILVGVLDLATAFRRQVIAQGVETLEQGERLLQLGCEEAQGYHIARPLPAYAIPDWLAAWRPDPQWVDCPAVPREHWPTLLASVAPHVET